MKLIKNSTSPISAECDVKVSFSMIKYPLLGASRGCGGLGLFDSSRFGGRGEEVRPQSLHIGNQRDDLLVVEPVRTTLLHYTLCDFSGLLFGGHSAVCPRSEEH